MTKFTPLKEIPFAYYIYIRLSLTQGGFMKVRDILKRKTALLETIAPDQTLRETIDKIVAKGIGDLLVMKDDFPVGIITERDIIRIMAAHGEKALARPVEEFMTRRLIIGIPDDDLDTVMAYMTNNRFRHLPIMDGRKLAGIISIGDIVKAQVHNLKIENRYLLDYITGKYPG
jgi:CBS domain-containing protein